MNVKVVFQNMKRSEFLENMINERFEGTLLKFDQASKGRVVVTVTMENSPFKAGADEFIVKMIASSLFERESIVIAKRAKSPYEAVAEINHTLQETLHRLEMKIQKEHIHEQRSYRQQQKWQRGTQEAS